ncbi:hypothetical protein EG329_004125 [Mollisiaceae sp. DMI_Dod_QoI]|nr:hypothetical protein EG329_004125 [Helotiales sp. DMI_Dod_QoI]
MRPPRPPNATLGLFFPVVGPPTFRFIKHVRDEDGIVRPVLKSLLGTDNFTRTLLSWNMIQQKELPYTLQLFQVPGKQVVNSFVYEVTRGTGFAREWGGPMVVLAHKHLQYALDDPIWRDVGCEDLRWMFEYFRYGDEPLSVIAVPAETGDSGIQSEGAKNGYLAATGMNNIKAVMIACEIERRTTGNTFVEVEIGPDHPIFRESPTQISVKMKLPLLMHKFPVQAVEEGMDDLWFRNPEAAAMNRIVDLDDRGWGYVADEWIGNIGSVLIARADKKDLDAKQVDMLAAFCAERLGHYMDLVVNKTPDYSKEVITNELTHMSIFHLFFERRRADLKWDDASWEHVKSPYEV